MPGWWSVPNLFTGVRLLLTPVIIVAILNRRHFLALAVFAAAALTDTIDGIVARRFGAATAAGAYLDPIADKILLSGVYIALAVISSVPWWFVILIFGRDLFLLLSSGFALAFTRLRQFLPSVWGKASTFLQILTAVAVMAANTSHSARLMWLAGALIWPAAAATIWSGVHYTWRGFHILRTH